MKQPLSKLLFLLIFLAPFSLLAVSSLRTYTYDSTGRLERVDHDSGISEVYTYDVMGNQTQRTVVIPPTLDTDGDGVPNLQDACPFDPNDPIGNPCVHDEDRDGVLDVVDAFPNDPAETVDTDSDGLGNNADVCPLDPAKTTSSGQCGCGHPDTDSDFATSSQVVTTFSDGSSTKDIAFPTGGGDQLVSVRLPRGAVITSAVVSLRGAPPFGGFADTSQSLGDVKRSGLSLGDVDGDGDLDAAIIKYVGTYPHPREIWLNDGNGVFTVSNQLLGNGEGAATLGDIDRDGDLDAIADGAAWFNDGHGLFTEDSRQGWIGSSLGDLDSDGDLDAFGWAGDGTAVWFNDGTGVFTYSGQQNPEISPMGMGVLGDIDGDGDLDVVDPSSGTWLNDGRGNFTKGHPLSFNYPIVLGDLDGDRDLDFFIQDVVGSPGSSTFLFRIFLNDGTGIFTEDNQVVLETPASLSLAVLGDLDMDGDLDVAISSSGGFVPWNVSHATGENVWFNDGKGHFSPAGQTPKIFGDGMAIGDLDGDGDPDLFTTNLNNYPGFNNVWLNQTEIRYPSNPSLDAASDGTLEWSFAGEFRHSETAPDLAQAVDAYLAGAPLTAQTVDVPLKLHSDSSGRLTLSDLAIQYTLASDQVADCNDGCPNDGMKSVPGQCGCGVADTDSDNDGVPDCHDPWPSDPTKDNTTDSDLDGTPDYQDLCANDPLKTSPGQCGCGEPETGDTDGDRVADCVDFCVFDPNRSGPPCRAEYQFPIGPARIHVEAGTTPFATAHGDFNGDRNNDIVVANYGSADISVLLGDGKGNFKPAVNYAVGANPVSVFVSDFDIDHEDPTLPRLDIAVANSGDNTVSVLIGNGDGTFKPAVNYNVGVTPWFVTGSNIDMTNGSIDLIVANSGGSDISVLLGRREGRGDGTFEDAVSYDVGGAMPRSVSIEDFNDDMNEDVAVAVRGANKVAILLGNGDGTLQPVQSYSTGTEPQAITTGYFNMDGHLDIITGNNKAYATLLLGNGDGTFQTYKSLNDAWAASALLTYSFNLDGGWGDDLAFISAGNQVGIMFGNGDGTFQPAMSYATGWQPWWVPGYGSSYGHFTTADFNRDGIPDLAIPHTGTSNGNYPSETISVLFGKGDGTFHVAPDVGVGKNPLIIASADFNGDGSQDLVTANGGEGSISVLLGNGDGTMGQPLSYATGAGPYGIAIGDYNSDTDVDLAVTNRTDKTVSILLGRGDGSFNPAVNYSVPVTPFHITSGDFNSDNKTDLAGSGFILFGNGDGTFAQAMSITGGSITLDLNSDGNLDLVVNGGARVRVSLGNGDGTFRPAVTYTSEGADTRGVTSADFNGDNIPDLAVSNYDKGSVSVFLGRGDGTFGAPVNFETGLGPLGLTAGDFDGDGRADIAIADWTGRDVTFLSGNGDGTFRRPIYFGVSSGTSGGPAAVCATDLNNDGKKDLAVTNHGMSTVTILLAR